MCSNMAWLSVVHPWAEGGTDDASCGPGGLPRSGTSGVGQGAAERSGEVITVKKCVVSLISNGDHKINVVLCMEHLEL